MDIPGGFWKFYSLLPQSSHSGWNYGKMNSLIEDGTVLGIGVPSVRVRLAVF
jgi:hypothetical protein